VDSLLVIEELNLLETPYSSYRIFVVCFSYFYESKPTEDFLTWSISKKNPHYSSGRKYAASPHYKILPEALSAQHPFWNDC